MSGQNGQNTCRKYDVCRNSPMTQTGFLCPITDMNSPCLFTIGKNYSRQFKTSPAYVNHSQSPFNVKVWHLNSIPIIGT